MFDFSFFDEIHDRTKSSAIKYTSLPQAEKMPVIPMWIADMDFKSSPAITEVIKNTADHGIYGYGEIDDEYKELVIDWYNRRMGWEIEKDELLTMPGVMFGVTMAIRALTKENDAVLICQPVYYPFKNVVVNNNRKLVVNELVLNNGRYEIDFNDFEDKIIKENVKVFLFCSPHNPVGRVWTKEELTKIAEICLKHNVYIISDEIHSDFIFEGAKHIPISTISDEVKEKTVTCVAPSKTFNLAGLQASNIIIPDKKVREKILKERTATCYHHLNIMSIEATKSAYKDSEAWLEGLLKYLKRNVEILQNAFPEDYKITALDMDGTYLAWLDCRKMNLSADELDDLFLKKAGVWLHNGETFGKGGKGFMRMNIACPTSVLEEAIERIKSVL
ncbi:MAG: pyridoxal phosphate-dependent aminotransferase [Ruminococcaceae bacterium]|nr:pyridoxal phosphate-dependent aminotransferase [Oscillospiraceae bacterium]